MIEVANMNGLGMKHLSILNICSNLKGNFLNTLIKAYPMIMIKADS